MDIKAKDLRPEVRQDILDKIKNELGYSEYNRLVDKVGEDGLIEFVLLQTVSNASPAASANASNRSSSEMQGCSSYIFYIAVLLGLTAGAYFPNGKSLGALYERIFPTVLVVVVVGILLLWLLSWLTSGDLQAWMAEWTNWYLLAGLITGIIGAVIGVIGNLRDVGIKIVGITLVEFIYCYLYGMILVFPYSRWVNNMKSESWQWVFIIIGILVTLIIINLGWIKVILPLFS